MTYTTNSNANAQGTQVLGTWTLWAYSVLGEAALAVLSESEEIQNVETGILTTGSAWRAAYKKLRRTVWSLHRKNKAGRASGLACTPEMGWAVTSKNSSKNFVTGVPLDNGMRQP